MRNEADDHPHAIVHDAGGPQLAHAGIDDRIARLPLLPGRKALRVVTPRKGGKLGPERLGRQRRPMMQEVIGEFAPEHFLQEFFRRTVEPATGLCLRRPHGVPALRRADLAKVQVGRQPGRDISIRPVPLIGIVREAIFDKAGQSLPRTLFARRPMCFETLRPVRLFGEQVPVNEAVAGQTAIPRREVGHPAWRPGLSRRKAGLRKGRVDLVGIARSVADRLRLMQQVAAVAVAAGTVGIARGLYPPLQRA